MKLREANEFVVNFHRHNKPVQGAMFAVGVSDGQCLVGVAIAGRPVARALDDGHTLEVTRCCVIENAATGACSFLYAALWRAGRALGYQKMITYTLQTESGASLRGAGWKIVAHLPANLDKGWRARPGREWQTVTGQAKLRWLATT